MSTIIRIHSKEFIYFIPFVFHFLFFGNTIWNSMQTKHNQYEVLFQDCFIDQT